MRSHQAWQIEWATATDGNVHAILRPVAVEVQQLALPLPQGAIEGSRERRLRTTQAWCEMKQLELPLYEDKTLAACGFLRFRDSERSKPVQLKLEALAA